MLQEIHISKLELLKFIVEIWDRGLANSFWDHVIQISITQINFQCIFSQLEKLNAVKFSSLFLQLKLAQLDDLVLTAAF